MKKLLSLLFITVAAMLPKSVWADAVIDGTTLTITTTNPGQVSGFVSGLSDKSSITTIILKGQFSGSDLEAISNSAGFSGVTTVDMSEAQFKAAQSSTYKVLSSTIEAGDNGDKGVIGGTLYKTNGNTVYTWSPANASTAEESGNMETPWWSERERSNHLSDYSNKYVKVKLANYFQKQQKFTIQTVTESSEANNYLYKEGVTQEQINTRTVDVSSGYNNNDKIKIIVEYKYYQFTKDGDDNVWTPVEPTANEGSFTYDNTDDQFKSEHFGNHSESEYVKFPVYTYHVFNWYYQSIETSAIPSGVNFDSGNYPSWAATEEGRAQNANDSHEYVGTAVGYNYYYVETSTSYSWETSDDTPSVVHYVVSSTADLPTAEANEYAKVGGTVYEHNGTSWNVSSAAATLEVDYSQMKFTYWKETLTTAITSNTADTSISSEIFSDCKLLTSVDYRSGNLTGFSDHDTEHGYTSGLSVTVGKDVTSIDASAFKDCNVLTTLTFDRDYTDLQENATYPKVLTINENAFLNCTSLTGVFIPNRVNQISNGAFKNSGITNLSFERRYTDEGDKTGKNFDVPLTIGSGAFEDCTNLTALTLPIRVTSIGTRSFANTSSLTSLTMREPHESNYELHDMTNGNAAYNPLQTIPSQAFSGSGVTEIKVPSSVTLIESAAFQQTNALKKITFQNTNTNPLVIKTGAFAGGREEGSPVLDVYVDVNPESRKLVCEYDAFTYTQMVGQTSVESVQFAKLHFNKDYWDYYQGDWKRGLAFRQDNLNAFKDGYNDADKGYQGKSTGEIDTTEGKYLTGSESVEENPTQYTPANGWQQFASTSTEIDVNIPKGSFMRTYSSNTAYIIPIFAANDATYGIVGGTTPMFDVYRITAFNDGFQTGDDTGASGAEHSKSAVATATKVELTDLNNKKYIPKETGLLMVGKVNTDYVVYFADATFDESRPETTYPYSLTGGNLNYLYPTCIDDQTMNGNGGYQTATTGVPAVTTNASGVSIVTLNSTIPYPYYNVSELEFRLFGYVASKNKFVRTQNAWLTRDKAYLKLTPQMFHWSNEYDGSENGGSGSGVDKPVDPEAGARVADVFLDFEDDDDNNTTGIKQVENTLRNTTDNVFYTLEGVKLTSRPTHRGIYIHNGRKIVIK